MSEVNDVQLQVESLKLTLVNLRSRQCHLVRMAPSQQTALQLICVLAQCVPAANCSTDPCNDCHRKWSYYESDITAVCEGKLYGNMWSIDYYF